jgi:hypothetical protein
LASMKSALRAGKSLHNDTRVFIDKYAHRDGLLGWCTKLEEYNCQPKMKTPISCLSGFKITS